MCRRGGTVSQWSGCHDGSLLLRIPDLLLHLRVHDRPLLRKVLLRLSRSMARIT